MRPFTKTHCCNNPTLLGQADDTESIKQQATHQNELVSPKASIQLKPSPTSSAGFAPNDDIYHVLSTATTKLARAAAEPDHSLVRLVAHANTLDALVWQLEKDAMAKRHLKQKQNMLETQEENIACIA